MRVPYDEMKSEFKRVLINRGFGLEDAEAASSMFVVTKMGNHVPGTSQVISTAFKHR